MTLGPCTQGEGWAGRGKELGGWRKEVGAGPAPALTLSQALAQGFLPQEALLGFHSAVRYGLPHLPPCSSLF